MSAEQKPVVDSSSSIRDDEINLFDLWDDIVAQKFWVLAGLLACVLLAGLYLTKATEVFKTQVVIKPTSANSVIELNAPQLKDIYSKTVDEAFDDARAAMLSKENRRNFYEAYLDDIKSISGLYSEQLTQSQNFANFNKLFSYKVSSTKDVEVFVEVALELPDAQKAADLLNAYTQFSLAAKLSDIKNTLDSMVLAHLGKLEFDAMQLREKYKGNQIRRNLLLTEAYSIAQAVGQTKPLFSKSQIVGTYEPPLYMFGTQALRAEEIAIQNRKQLAKELPYGEDHFIDALPSLIFKINQLKALVIDYTKVNLASIDEPAIVPTGAIKPKKLLIVALSCIAGLFIGLMMALLMASYRRHKKV